MHHEQTNMTPDNVFNHKLIKEPERQGEAADAMGEWKPLQLERYENKREKGWGKELPKRLFYLYYIMLSLEPTSAHEMGFLYQWLQEIAKQGGSLIKMEIIKV